jgi:hypothetical protein
LWLPIFAVRIFAAVVAASQTASQLPPPLVPEIDGRRRRCAFERAIVAVVVAEIAVNKI